ncbi:MAG: hypothetical protein MZV65_52215 [Chromatiales bacterium]|nr:hypothetical protein [Chromatiales bacterium]
MTGLEQATAILTKNAAFAKEVQHDHGQCDQRGHGGGGNGRHRHRDFRRRPGGGQTRR